MDVWPDDLSPREIADLRDPSFLAHVRQQFPHGPVRPDHRDFDPAASPRTEREQTREYRLAQARKLVRMYRGWKTAMN